MALIQCPECGRTISDRAYQCPECGLPQSEFYATDLKQPIQQHAQQVAPQPAQQPIQQPAPQPAPQPEPAKTPNEPMPEPTPSEPQKLEERGELNGYDWVDLGLSVRWARYNIGATSSAQAGTYFAWGESAPKGVYNNNNCLLNNRDTGSIIEHPHFDTALRLMGKGWRMPSVDECKELIEKCVWHRARIGDVRGYKIVGPNGNYIFLPVTGYYFGYSDNNNLDHGDTFGCYWSGSPDEYSEYNDKLLYAVSMWFNISENKYDISVDEPELRCSGLAIRPVTDLPQHCSRARKPIVNQPRPVEPSKPVEPPKPIGPSHCFECHRPNFVAKDGQWTYCKWCGTVYNTSNNGWEPTDTKYTPRDYFRNIWDVSNVIKYDTTGFSTNNLFRTYLRNNFGDCFVETRVAVQTFNPGAPTYCAPINFLITKGNRKVAIILAESQRYKRYSILETMEQCNEHGITPLRFIIEFDNDESYVVNRIRQYL